MFENFSRRGETPRANSSDALLVEDFNTYNGINVKKSLTQVAWEPTWRLALNESYIGPEFGGLDINEIKYG